MKKIALAAVCVALTALLPAQLAAPVVSAASATLPPARVDPRNAVHARIAFTNGSDVRDLAASLDGDAVWAATSAGLDRYDAATRARTHFGIETGLDTLDVRAVHVVPFALIVDTAESRCVGSSDPNSRGFRCFSARPPAPRPPAEETLHGAPIVARVATSKGTFIATRGAGVWLGDARLDALPTSTASFVRKVAFYNHREWAGTFDDGLVTLDDRGTHAVPGAPMRMVNDVVATPTALFVAANEGLFVTRDGASFQRIDAVGHGATGVAVSSDRVLVTTTSAIWRIRATGHRFVVDGNWWRPAGSRSLQGIATSTDVGGVVAWAASEDRGVIRFDPTSNAPRFVAHDKLAGAPTSWVVALAGDERGGVFAATLRDGVFHVDRDGTIATVAGVPSGWTLDASFAAGKLCVGTQAGAACWSDWHGSPSKIFTGLPDGRVHDVERVGDELFIATEAGIAKAEAT